MSGNNGKNVVLVCAHPDDMWSVAGTLALLRRAGYGLFDFCLTRGQRGHSPGPGLDTGAVRSKEEEAACRVLGAETLFFDQMDGELYATPEVCGRVATELARIKPAAVITAWALEKPDHSAAFAIAHKALYLADLYWTTEFYFTQFDLSGYMFYPDVYVNVTAVIDTARAVARCYPSQVSDAMVEQLVAHKRAVGQSAWCDYAEGFKTALPLINQRWGRTPEIGRVLLELADDTRTPGAPSSDK